MQKSQYLKQIVDELSMDKSGKIKKVKKLINEFETIKEVIGGMYVPCTFRDELPAEIGEPAVAIMDVFSICCSIAVARKYHAKTVFVSPLIEPAMLQALSGGPLPVSYVMSVIQATLPPLNFLQRLGNIFAHSVFKLFLYLLPLAKLFLKDENNLFGVPEPTLVLVNNHKYFDLPLPRTNAYMDIGNSMWKPPGELTPVSFKLTLDDSDVVISGCRRIHAKI